MSSILARENPPMVFDPNVWPLLFTGGFGNIFDVGYGFNYEGQTLVAAAINATAPGAQKIAWLAVERFCRTKTRRSPAC